MALIRNIDEVDRRPVDMEGADRVSMAMMVGREDGAPHFSMRQFEVAPGGRTPQHSHDYEHEVLVLDGAGDVLLEGERRPIRPGDVIYVPADQEHQFRADQERGLRFICLAPTARNCGGVTPGT